MGDEPVLLKAILQYAKEEHTNLDYADVIAFVKRLRDTMIEDLSKKQELL